MNLTTQIIILLILLFSMRSHLVETTFPKITDITQTQIKDVGDTAELSCRVENAENNPVVWIKTHKILGPKDRLSHNGEFLIANDSKKSVVHDKGRSTYTLKIKDIQVSDGGFYHCRIIISESATVEDETEVQVRQSPYIYNNSTESIVVYNGEAVQMECYAEGIPPPTISWKRENNAILHTGGPVYRGNILTIQQITKDDRGDYYCVAENGVGHGIKRKISLKVEFGPIVIVPIQRIGQALHFGVDLKCHIEAYPPSVISWIKDNATLQNDQHYSMSLSASTVELTYSTLRIAKIENWQYGDYVCKATNRWGSDEGKINLFETDIPKYPAIYGNAFIAASSTIPIPQTLFIIAFSIRYF